MAIVSFRTLRERETCVDYYLSHGFSQGGERSWRADEVLFDAVSFVPASLKILNPQGIVSDTVRSTEPFQIEFTYRLDGAITGLRVGFYLISTRGEFVFTSFDSDDPEKFETFGTRGAGTYRSRCTVPADLLNKLIIKKRKDLTGVEIYIILYG